MPLKPNKTDNISDQELLNTLQRLDRFAQLTDSHFRIPFTRIRFGIDSIVGLIPIVGETIGLVLSFYLLIEASKLNVPLSIKLKMLGNILLDWVIGLVPILGDVADVAFKANNRNMKLILEYVSEEHQRRNAIPVPSGMTKTSKVMCLLAAALATAISIYYLGNFS